MTRSAAPRIAVYPGSFDPMTWGHVKLVEQVARVFDEVVVAIGVNPNKNCLFSPPERVALAEQALQRVPNVRVVAFEGLLTRFLAENNLHIVVRGLRGGRDMDDNFLQELFAWGQHEGVGVTPFYVPPRPGEAILSSSLLKMAILEQADAVGMAPLSSIHAVQARMLGQHLLGVTGSSATGKTHICREFVRLGAARGIEVHHIDVDKLVHAIYADQAEPLYVKLRADIIAAYGSGVAGAGGSIDRRALGHIVFADAVARAQLEQMIYGPLMVLLRQTLRGKKGLVLVDAPTLAEAGWLHLVNNHVLLVKADEDTARERLQERHGDAEAVRLRLAAQDDAVKLGLIENAIARDGSGSLTEIFNGEEGADTAAVEAAFEAVLGKVGLLKNRDS